MSVIAEFTVPAESFLLAEALSANPETVVELQQVVAHSDDDVVPFFWVRDGGATQFGEAIRDDSTVEHVVLLDGTDRGASYRARWTETAAGVVYAYLETGATILEATGRDDSWRLRMRFDDDEALAEFHTHLRERSVPFGLEQLYHPDEVTDDGRHGLTSRQRRTLVEALGRGYYEVPRQVSMTDLADEIGTTQQTLSKRFRRAHATLVGNCLLASESGPTPNGDRHVE